MSDSSLRLPRRDVLRLLAASTLVPSVPSVLAQDSAKASVAKGYGTDPNLTKDYKPGDVWPLTLNDTQRKTVIAFVDTILPEDEFGPSASTLRVHDYIDEWVSAPYPAQQASRPVILKGLEWLELESQKLHKTPYASLTSEQKINICSSIAEPDPKTPGYKEYNGFFRQFRAIAMGAYYSSTAGWKAIGYIGNVPSLNYDGPSEDLLKRLDLTQTVQ